MQAYVNMQRTKRNLQVLGSQLGSSTFVESGNNMFTDLLLGQLLT